LLSQMERDNQHIAEVIEPHGSKPGKP
jgi:hypothetical protein